MSSNQILFERAFNALREPLFVLGSRGEIVALNLAFREFFGAEESKQLEYFRAGSFWPQRAEFARGIDEITSEFISPSGVQYSVKLGIIDVGDRQFLVRVLAAISKRDTFNKYHSQRLETLGMLAGGVAHDFNNILAGVLGHVTYLKTILPAKGSHIESLNAIEEGGKKASIMTQQILNFSRLETAEKPLKLSLSDLATRTCVLLKGAISPVYSLKCEAEPGMYVLGVEGGLAQVIVNLVINARDALSTQDGKITVKVFRENNRDTILHAIGKGEVLPKSYVCLQVHDNGAGMPPEIISRIFEPYFSTKKDKGTGLGLATVDAIVKALGGAVSVSSREGHGTIVSVYFPEASEGLSAEALGKMQAKSLTMRGGKERILIVDDEFPVRNVLCVSLEHLGYTVKVAASGTEALERFEQAEEPFDLVILDMLMPQLSGEKVFLRLRELDPNIRVLIISGYTSEEPVRRILEAGKSAFMQKPFTIEELSKKVRECMEA